MSVPLLDSSASWSSLKPSFVDSVIGFWKLSCTNGLEEFFEDLDLVTGDFAAPSAAAIDALVEPLDSFLDDFEDLLARERPACWSWIVHRYSTVSPFITGRRLISRGS